MQEDLENFAKEMQKLKPNDRLYWLQSLAHCRATSSPSTYPTYKTLNEVEADFLRFKSILIQSISSILTSGKEKEIPVVKKGIDSLMSVSKEEREEFYDVVQKKVPTKIATKNSHRSFITMNTRTHG